MNARSLAGRSIVITRPLRQAGNLARLIEEAGGQALRYPSIAIEPVRSPALDAIIGALASYDLAVFISRNAVEHGLARVREFGVRASLPQAAAVGAGTAKALESAGVEGVAAPAGPADSEALLALPQFQAMEGRRVLVFRGVGGREWLAAALRSRGAVVDYAECYRRGVPATDLRPLIADWASGGVDAVTVSSREGLANLAGLLGEAGLAHLRTTPAFVPHARVADEARALGIANVTVAGASDEEMHGALVAYFGRAG